MLEELFQLGMISEEDRKRKHEKSAGRLTPQRLLLKLLVFNFMCRGKKKRDNYLFLPLIISIIIDVDDDSVF